MKLDFENLFLKACQDGINIFTGAGFSIDSFNNNGEPMPLGQELADELSVKFNVSNRLPLGNMAAIIESRNKEPFYSFLREKVNITSYSDEYNFIRLLKIKSWFTTNIDNLTEKIFEGSNDLYLNNNAINGPSFGDKKAIEFYPLHGSILNNEKPLIFSSLAIASTFSTSPRLWNDLIRAVDKHPILFWGYSLNDSGILQTLNSIRQDGSENKDKWIVLFKEMPDEEDYFRSLGFKIIVASNKELLNYFKKHFSKVTTAVSKATSTKNLFGQDFVPKSSAELPLREINEFYLGSTPIWSDIYSKNLYRTSHYSNIQNYIFSTKNTIVIGTPASGKTTLLMQLSAFTEFEGHKIILNYPTQERAINVVNVLSGEKALVFIDNFTENIQSFLYFNKFPNIKLIGFDREHNFEIVSHFIDRNKYNIYTVTELTEIDMQEVYQRIPHSIKTNTLKTKIHSNDEQASMFEFVSLNTKYPSIKERYKNIIGQIEKTDELLTDFLLLASYVHHCRTPLSFDMTFSYFQEYIKNYKEVYELKSQLGSLITEYIGDLVDTDEQDYFTPRSVIVSETILEQVESRYLRRMLHRFVDNLPPYKIACYHIFRKKAHDKMIMINAFPNWEEGKYYYERLLQDEPNNPYLLQQGALYLSYKGKHSDAFYWIERAKNITNNRVFSIRNSHAIILFDGNIKKEDESVKATLDRSMEILKQCYLEDKRKLYHAKKYGEQAVEYYTKYGDSKAKDYLNQASIWLGEETKNNNWHYGIKDLKRRIENIIQKAS